MQRDPDQRHSHAGLDREKPQVQRRRNHRNNAANVNFVKDEDINEYSPIFDEFTTEWIGDQEFSVASFNEGDFMGKEGTNRKRKLEVDFSCEGQSYEPILSTHPVKGRTSVLQLVVDHRTHDIDQAKRKQGATIQRFKDCEKPNKTHQNKVHRSVKKRLSSDFH
uniref:Uncharacterized protein n=1 Tax=Magallana gigas TaxID=29159 RepID=A0A8W8MGT6_MAGGI